VSPSVARYELERAEFVGVVVDFVAHVEANWTDTITIHAVVECACAPFGVPS